MTVAFKSVANCRTIPITIKHVVNFKSFYGQYQGIMLNLSCFSRTLWKVSEIKGIAAVSLESQILEERRAEVIKYWQEANETQIWFSFFVAYSAKLLAVRATCWLLGKYVPILALYGLIQLFLTTGAIFNFFWSFLTIFSSFLLFLYFSSSPLGYSRTFSVNCIH